MDQLNLKQEVTLYDPHPGFGGALVPLPEPILNVAREIDGKKMTLEQALEKINGAITSPTESLEIIEDYQYIRYQLKESRGTHSFRLIRYR